MSGDPETTRRRRSFGGAIAGALAAFLVVMLVPAIGNATGTLVSIVDADSAGKAQVDGGRLRVGDGSGPLTINGDVGLDPAHNAISGMVGLDPAQNAISGVVGFDPAHNAISGSVGIDPDHNTVTGTMGIDPSANNVNLLTSPGKPVLTQDLGMRGFIPYTQTLTASMNCTCSGVFQAFTAAPAGKQLLVETLSASAVLPPGQSARADVFTNQPTTRVNIPMISQGKDPNGSDHWAGTAQVDYYVPIGATPQCEIDRSAQTTWTGGPFEAATCTISGYLFTPPA